MLAKGPQKRETSSRQSQTNPCGLGKKKKEGVGKEKEREAISILELQAQIPFPKERQSEGKKKAERTKNDADYREPQRIIVLFRTPHFVKKVHGIY